MEQKISYEKLYDALRAYIIDDIEAAERDYVVDKLHAMCGLSDEDIVELGLGWLLEED